LALKDVFKGLSNKRQQMRYAAFLNGQTAIFSQFGQNIYASDVVQMCIDRIATEVSKLQPRHIRTDSNGMQVTVKSSINRLFKFSPNPLMTTRDFLEKTAWLLYMDYNCFIYPTYETIDGVVYYSGFYPLKPIGVDFLQDATDRLFIKLRFRNGNEFTIPYSDIMHLRKKFSVNDIMGGGVNGQPDNTALLKVLEINDTVLQGLGKAVKSSLSIRGVMKINTMLDGPKMDEERKRLEAAVASGDSGILPLDLKGEFIPLTIDPKLLDRDTLDFLQNKVINWYGVSVPILTGKFTDEEYQAFYEQTLEPILISLGQAFSRCLFSDRELDVGNEIVFYQRDMMYLSTKSKLELIKIAGEQGLLRDNQKLALLGYPPIEGGDRISQSLNYIDRNIVNEYQMKHGAKSTKTKGDEEDE
jgi:HK97 family phage portal protein